MIWKQKEKDEKQKTEKQKTEKQEMGRKASEYPQVYVMKKNAMMRFLRVVLWVMLAFVFVRGVVSCLQRDSAQEARQIIHDFRDEFASYKDDSEELMGFSQNFAREYLTYERRREDDYARRIRPYVSDDLYSQAASLTDFQGKATAVYVKAYRKESYSEDQYDVFVLADVAYEPAEKNGKEAETETEGSIRNRTVTLKVPVYTENGKYVVEGIPMIVNDSMKITGYSAPAFMGTAITDGRSGLIEEAVTSFLSAYYEQDQNVIEYYLTRSADRAKFRGLSGRYGFDKLEQIRCYETENGILCLVDFRVTDAENGSHLLQSVNLSVMADGNRYYIQDMNTKTGHL